jgi:hypothetical protein
MNFTSVIVLNVSINSLDSRTRDSILVLTRYRPVKYYGNIKLVGVDFPITQVPHLSLFHISTSLPCDTVMPKEKGSVHGGWSYIVSIIPLYNES